MPEAWRRSGGGLARLVRRTHPALFGSPQRSRRVAMALAMARRRVRWRIVMSAGGAANSKIIDLGSYKSHGIKDLVTLFRGCEAGAGGNIRRWLQATGLPHKTRKRIWSRAELDALQHAYGEHRQWRRLITQTSIGNVMVFELMEAAFVLERMYVRCELVVTGARPVDRVQKFILNIFLYLARIYLHEYPQTWNALEFQRWIEARKASGDGGAAGYLALFDDLMHSMDGGR